MTATLASTGTLIGALALLIVVMIMLVVITFVAFALIGAGLVGGVVIGAVWALKAIAWMIRPRAYRPASLTGVRLDLSDLFDDQMRPAA